MATKTKTAAKSTKSAAAPAKKQGKPAEVVKMIAELKTKNSEGRDIQAVMTKQLLTVEQIAAKTGYSVGRCSAHVEYEISKGRSKRNTKGQIVVVSQPVRRGQA